MSLNKVEAYLEFVSSCLPEVVYLISDKCKKIGRENALGLCCNYKEYIQIDIYLEVERKHISEFQTAVHESIHAIQYRLGILKTLKETNKLLEFLNLPKPSLSHIKQRWGSKYNELEYAAVALETYPEIVIQILLDKGLNFNNLKKFRKPKPNLIAAVILSSATIVGFCFLNSQHQNLKTIESPQIISCDSTCDWDRSGL